MSSKFKNLYNYFKNQLLHESQNKHYDIFNDECFNEILHDYIAGKYINEVDQIERAINYTLNQYKQKNPKLFDNITIEIDCFKNDKDIDTFAEVDSTNHKNIRFNIYPLLFEIKYNNGNLDDLLDILEYDNPVIAHELAHIIDIEQRGWPKNNNLIHDKQFQKIFTKLTNKRFINYELLSESEIIKSDYPQYLYHATYKPLLQKIKLLGLGNTKRTYWEDSKPGVVYLADDPDIAESYAEINDNLQNEDWLDEIIIFKINTDNLDKSKLFIDNNILLDKNEQPHTFEYHNIIPFEKMELIKK